MILNVCTRWSFDIHSKSNVQKKKRAFLLQKWITKKKERVTTPFPMYSDMYHNIYTVGPTRKIIHYNYIGCKVMWYTVWYENNIKKW